MRSPEKFSPEASRQHAVVELTESGALPPEGFSSLEAALSSLKKVGESVNGKMADGIGEWKVTRGPTEADFNIQSGGDYEQAEAA